MPKFELKVSERERDLENEPPPLECGQCTGVAEHVPDEYRLDRAAKGDRSAPEPLLPLED